MKYAFITDDAVHGGNLCIALGITEAFSDICTNMATTLFNQFKTELKNALDAEESASSIEKGVWLEYAMNHCQPANMVEAMYVGFVVASTMHTCADMAIAESQRHSFMEFAGNMRQRFDDLMQKAKNNDETE